MVSSTSDSDIFFGSQTSNSVAPEDVCSETISVSIASEDIISVSATSSISVSSEHVLGSGKTSVSKASEDILQRKYKN